MKKLIALVLALVCVLSLVGCGPNYDKDYLNGTVTEIHDTYVLVECVESPSGVLQPKEKISVSAEFVATNGLSEIEVGDNVRIEFAGVQEKIPVGFDTVFAIYLLDENGEVISPE